MRNSGFFYFDQSLRFANMSNIRKIQVQMSNNGRPNQFACGSRVLKERYIIVGIHNAVQGRLDYVVSVCKYVEGIDDYRQYLDGTHEVFAWKQIKEMPVEIEYDLSTPLKSNQYVGENQQQESSKADLSNQHDLPEGLV